VTRLLLSLLLLAAPLAAEPLRFGTEGAYAPYTFRSPDGTLQGLDIDLGEEICARLNRDCDWIVRAWTDLIPGLEAGAYDAIIAAMAITADRQDRVDFTRPYEPDPAPSIYVGWQAFVDLDSAVIAVQGGTIHEDHLRDLGRNLRPYPTALDAFNAMKTRETDLVFGPPSFLEHRVFRTSRPCRSSRAKRSRRAPRPLPWARATRCATGST